MTHQLYHLAQANLAFMRFPVDDPRMADFVAQLEFINSLAERSSGFVWRLQGEAGDARSIRIFDDEEILLNMSVWQSLESLHDFTYRSAHAGPLRQRKKWFSPSERPSSVLWWIFAGQLPTVREAEERFNSLWTEGPSEEAFTFKQPFPPRLEVELSARLGLL